MADQIDDLERQEPPPGFEENISADIFQIASQGLPVERVKIFLSEITPDLISDEMEVQKPISSGKAIENLPSENKEPVLVKEKHVTQLLQVFGGPKKGPSLEKFRQNKDKQ